MPRLLGIAAIIILVPMLAFNLLGILLLPATFLVVAGLRRLLPVGEPDCLAL